LSKATQYLAIGLWLLHFMIWIYVEVVNMQYDQGDLWGLLWWVAAFWLLPVLSILLIVFNWLVNWWRHASGGEDSL
jgi:hypothetical protein